MSGLDNVIGTPHSSANHGSPSSLIRLVAASVVGTAIELYDFFLSATAAALVFNKDFFPTSNPLTAIFIAFLTYSVSFLPPPLCATFFLHTAVQQHPAF